jgi:hypothetical protein
MDLVNYRLSRRGFIQTSSRSPSVTLDFFFMAAAPAASAPRDDNDRDSANRLLFGSAIN